MSKTLHYVFDPLCGWCYGAGGVLSTLSKAPQLELHLWPSGLFAGAGARPMDDSFAAYAWSNDQRIERLTGQCFTERYRDQVLANRQQAFDSGPATLALTAVGLTAPGREPDALEAIQQARYIEGQDVTQVDTLVALLKRLGFEQAAVRLAQHDGELLAANRVRVGDAQGLLQQFGVRGVPAFILETQGQRQLLDSSLLFSQPQVFIDQLTAA